MAAVRRYEILDTPPDGSFDDITALAADLFAVPIAIISLVDHDRIWFKSHHGLDVPQIGRDPGLCASAILKDGPYVVTDASIDPRSLANPLVAGDFGLKFYVAVPLHTHDGHNLGTLCVIDREARTVSESQIGWLEKLARLVMDQMELRLAARSAAAEMAGLLEQKDRALARTGLLAKEIDHRVMNSLQFVSSLLTMQARGAKDQASVAELKLAAGRVAAVARVHRHFYLDDAVENTCGLAYAQRLVADLSDMVGDKTMTVSGASSQIPTTSIMPLGLIINELVTNAAKHGAEDIAVSFAKDAHGRHQLTVSDDGEGLPPRFDPHSSQGLGMKVVLSLVRQLRGDLSADPGPGGRGATFTVSFV